MPGIERWPRGEALFDCITQGVKKMDRLIEWRHFETFVGDKTTTGISEEPHDWSYLLRF